MLVIVKERRLTRPSIGAIVCDALECQEAAHSGEMKSRNWVYSLMSVRITRKSPKNSKVVRELGG